MTPATVQTEISLTIVLDCNNKAMILANCNSIADKGFSFNNTPLRKINSKVNGVSEIQGLYVGKKIAEMYQDNRVN